LDKKREGGAWHAAGWTLLIRGEEKIDLSCIKIE